MKNGNNRISKTLDILHQIDHILSGTVEAWSSFECLGGDVIYFPNIEGPGGISRYSLRSLRAIKATFRDLANHQKNIALLKQRCKDLLDKVSKYRLLPPDNGLDPGNLSSDSMTQLKLDLSVETKETADYNGLTADFVVMVCCY